MPKIICLTPVKNEIWILKKFLESASLWADYIIIADQGSTDGSLEIAKIFPKVILIENKNKSYSESERQKMLIDEARKIKGDNILIALDADEVLTANSINNSEWGIIKKLDKGTVIRFVWANLLPQKNIYWVAPSKMPFGFIDDGSEHAGTVIHSPRIPIPQDKKEYYPVNIKVMHFQYANWERMKSKHRWYQCWELINNPKRSIIGIYRQYHHMYAIKKSQFQNIPNEWLDEYKNMDIDFSEMAVDKFYYWDYEVASLFEKHGLSFFSRIDIWDIDWNEVVVDNKVIKKFIFKDPRSIYDKLILQWLRKTQYYSNSFFIKITDKFLKIFLGL